MSSFTAMTKADLPENRYTIVENVLIMRTDLSTEARFLYILMRKMARPDSTGSYIAYPSRRYISGVMRNRTKDGALKCPSKRTVSDILGELTRANLLRAYQDNRGQVPRYYVGRLTPCDTSQPPPCDRAQPEQDLSRTRERAKTDPRANELGLPDPPQTKRLTDAYQRFVDWYTEMFTLYPNDVPKPSRVFSCEGMFYHCRTKHRDDDPFGDYAALSRGIAVLVKKKTKIATLPGMLNAKNPSILTVLAHSHMSDDDAPADIEWGENDE